MKRHGSAEPAARPPDRVYAALHRPERAGRARSPAAVAGAGRRRPLQDERDGRASPPSRAPTTARCALSDQQPPNSFVLHASGAGAPGTVDATVRVTLSRGGDGTRADYDADAVIGGMVGGVGQRMLTGVAKKMAGQFFDNVDAVLTGRVPAAAPALAPEPVGAGASAATGAPGVYRAPVKAAGAGDELRVPFWIVLAGVGAGAFWALAGVLVGWRIARRNHS